MNAKRHLLIVDENPYVAGVLVQTLKADFAITVANTGQEAARLLIQGIRFDCVLTELNFPQFSGLDLTKFIRSNRLLRHIPIVVLSNASDSNTRIECLEQGVDTYISKTFNPMEVRARLNALLRRSAPALDESQERAIPIRIQPESKAVGPLRSRILSIILGDYAMSQSV
jgi:DNA-binding response OmpR family regulator